MTVIGSGGKFIGPSFRSRRLGPEWGLLDEFLKAPLFRVPSGCEAIVFREPRLPSGFPDLVIVILDEQMTGTWVPAREALTREDVRLAHYIYRTGKCSVERLKTLFAGTVSSSLQRLAAAQMISLDGSNWQLAPLNSVFATQEIIAVEAKMSEWKVGLEQALLNTWFASVSYMLVPSVANGSAVLERARALGIGVWTKEDNPVKPGKPQLQPCSYASWLFNEWALRASAEAK